MEVLLLVSDKTGDLYTIMTVGIIAYLHAVLPILRRLVLLLNVGLIFFSFSISFFIYFKGVAVEDFWIEAFLYIVHFFSLPSV